jgi:serine/threonine protein phosphatase PrpC
MRLSSCTVRTPRIETASFDPHQQFCFHIDHVNGVVLLVEGYGSFSGGTIGSEIVRDIVSVGLPVRDWERLDEMSAMAAMHHALEDANRVLRKAWELSPLYKGMGASFAGIWLLEEFFIMGHVGDIAIYRASRDGLEAEALTRDESIECGVGQNERVSLATNALGMNDSCRTSVFSRPARRNEVLLIGTSEIKLAFGPQGPMDVLRQRVSEPQTLPASILDQVRVRRGAGHRCACVSLWFDS